MRIQSQNGNPWPADDKIGQQGFVQNFQLIEQGIAGDIFRNLGKRNMGGNNANAHELINHQHQHTVAFELVLEVFGMTGKVELIGFNIGFANRCSDQGIESFRRSYPVRQLPVPEGRIHRHRGWIFPVQRGPHHQCN